MTQVRTMLLLIGGLISLSGCVASMAASAISMAARSAQGPQVGNEHLQPTARAACTAQAARYGAVNVIDVEQRGPAKIMVYGTAGTGEARRPFKCGFGTKVTSFKLLRR